jgi:tripartite-type tricarboxylate transporter receptor subunit TctC
MSRRHIIKRYNKRVFFVFIAFLILCPAVVSEAWAEGAYPSHSINMIVPFAPGGSVDTGTRAMAIYMGKYLKTSIVITNILGASGVIGYGKCYKAKPDGYTLMSLYTLPPFVEELRKPVGYKTLDLTPIAGLIRDIPMLVVHPDGSKNFKDFVNQATIQNVTIGSNGRYTINGLQGLMMTEELGLKVNWINYSGSGESLVALAGKHIDAAMTMSSAAMPLIKGGKVRPLILFSDKRSIRFPTVPVPGEMGFTVPFVDSLLGIMGPPGLDQRKVKILLDAIGKAAKDPDYLAWMEKVSTTEPSLMLGDDYAKEMQRNSKIAEKYKRFFTN